jgi:hypothetical protein
MTPQFTRIWIYGNVILWTTVAVVALWLFMALRPASAQGLYIGRDGRAHPQIIAGPDGSIWPVIPTYCQHGWGPCPVALAPPIPPFVPPVPLPAPPPLAYAPPPPPPPPVPLGWIWRTLAPCADPACGTLVVQVQADGANIRFAPAGFGVVLGAVANGTPLIPLQRDGDWVLVAAGCPLRPTFTISVTAGVPLSVCS